MNLALVGGAGFIGRHTVQELLRHGHTVTVIDKDVDKCKNFFDTNTLDKIVFIKCDVLNYKDVELALNSRNKKFDAVYMFAAISDSKENTTDIPYAINTNIMCLANTMEAANKAGIKRIIFSSTVWVYSVSNQTSVDETSPLLFNDSDHVYTTCKLACEALVKNFCSIRDLDFTILRYGIAYGPGCHQDTILSKFITNAIKGVPLTITGDGNIYRNFLNVKDHASGNRLALCKKAKNQTINLEGPEKITLNDVAQRVKSLHNKDVTINYTGVRQGDYRGKEVDNTRAYDLLEWTPTVDFKSGSKLLYEYIKENISNSSTC